MKSSMRVSCVGFALICLMAGVGLAQNYLSDPEKVAVSRSIYQWTGYYGQNNAKAADVTTILLREGLTKEAWVEKVTPVLKRLAYIHLGGPIQTITLKDDTAIAVMESRVGAQNKIYNQIEVFHLIKYDGVWLIERIDVKDPEESEQGPQPQPAPQATPEKDPPRK